MGHANARFFGPQNGGIIFNSNLSIGAFRQDHDQVYQQNVNIRYQPKKSNWWTDFTWRYDSGLVVGAINNMAEALALTAAQQSAIGLYCGGATGFALMIGSRHARRLTMARSGSTFWLREQRMTIITLRAQSQRNIFHVGMGNDNIFHKERIRTVVRFKHTESVERGFPLQFSLSIQRHTSFPTQSFQAQIGWAFHTGRDWGVWSDQPPETNITEQPATKRKVCINACRGPRSCCSSGIRLAEAIYRKFAVANGSSMVVTPIDCVPTNTTRSAPSADEAPARRLMTTARPTGIPLWIRMLTSPIWCGAS